MTPQKFRNIVWKHYREHGRHTLPWRATQNPYRILVSEIMLQQTQVDRVIPYYKEWMKNYPTADALAKAPLSDVLKRWQGLGYNRRAKMLHEAAKVVSQKHAGRMPKTVEELEQLPGVGSYTARAVTAFAYNQDVVFVETNLRTAVIHAFFPNKETVSDTEVSDVLAKALPKGNAREWYAALMDYGAYLKRSGVRVNNKSKGYVKQKSFKGSGREVRGAILRTLSKEPTSKAKLVALFSNDRREQLEVSITQLLKEGLVEKKGVLYRLPA